jgi:hypothetical protein
LRHEGWESSLAQYLAAAQSLEFQWGVNDCALWSAEWVRIATDKDFGAPWRGRYKTEKGAKRLMLRRQFSEVADIASDALVEQPVRLAKRGDLVLHPETESLGICNGLRSHFLGVDGHIVIDTLACPRAWEVG